MTESTQLDLLRHDVEELHRILDENPTFADPLADVSDADRHAKYLVVADLTWRIWHSAIAARVLLTNELYSPALVVIRSQLEAHASLAYLAEHKEFETEAIIFLAFSYLRQLRDFRGQDVATELEAILDQMPESLVAEARRRSGTHPWTWNGLKLRQTLAAAGITGYENLYPYLSSETHASLLGHHVTVLTSPDGKVTIKAGRELNQGSIEATANFVRRNLHSAFKIMWRVFDAPPAQLKTEDPEAWAQERGAK